MKVSEVTNDDGRFCAQLLNLLAHGQWKLSGPDISAHSATVKWVHDLARLLAEQLKSKAPSPVPASDQGGGFKVKSMGPLPSPMRGQQASKSRSTKVKKK